MHSDMDAEVIPLQSYLNNNANAPGEQVENFHDKEVHQHRKENVHSEETHHHRASSHHGHSHATPDEYDADKSKEWGLRQYFHIIRADREARKVTMFASLMLLLAFVEIFISAISGSIAGVSSGFHSLFDGIALCISVSSLIITKRKQTRTYSYGLERFEVVAVFSNVTLMIFVALYVSFESLERLFELGETHDYGVIMITSVLSIVIHIWGVAFLFEQLTMRSESVLHPSKQTMSGLLNAITDILPAVAAFIVGWTSITFGWSWTDPLFALINACLIAYRAYPTLGATGRILLQSVPMSIKPLIEQNLRDANTVDGVLEVHNAHFWTCSPGVFCWKSGCACEERYQ